MKSTLSTIAAAVAFTITTVFTTPAIAAGAPTEPATVYFTPYALNGCRMSSNPKDSTKPLNYNVTIAAGCVTPPYAFGSYVESANSVAANGPCTFSIFSGPKCTGTVKSGVRTTYAQCVTDVDAGGQSVRLACGA